MRTATIEHIGGGTAEEPEDAATTTIKKNNTLPLTATELCYPQHFLNTLLLARLLLKNEPIPEAPNYETLPKQCLADGIDAAKRNHTTLPGAFIGVPKPCALTGCGAKCTPYATMGGAVRVNEIPRSACQNTLNFGAQIEAYDKAIAGYNQRHPDQSEAFVTDSVSPVASPLDTEAALAHDMGIEPGLVREMDALG